MICRGLDTERQVLFYEQEFYPLSNFSSFAVEWAGMLHQTSEHAYHWSKFGTVRSVGARSAAIAVHLARSAHDALKIAERSRSLVRLDWLDVRVDVMREILRAKVAQHEYVRRKLLETGDRELIENSWRDDFWGWGERRDGRNELGRLWMEIRAEIRG